MYQVMGVQCVWDVLDQVGVQLQVQLFVGFYYWFYCGQNVFFVVEFYFYIGDVIYVCLWYLWVQLEGLLCDCKGMVGVVFQCVVQFCFVDYILWVDWIGKDIKVNGFGYVSGFCDGCSVGCGG